MMPAFDLLLAVEVAALGVIVWHTACGLLHMTRDTRTSLVAVVALLFSGAVARIYVLAADLDTSDPSTAMLLVSVALGMLVERRQNDQCPCLIRYPVERHHNDREMA